jgi:hypothetical protein
MARPINWKHHLTWAGFLLLYGVSLFLPAMIFDHGKRPEDTYPGAAVLVMGWLGLFVGQFGWFANMPWLIAMVGVIARIPLMAAIPSVLALGISLHTFVLFSHEVPRDEGGVNNMILTGLGPGAYVWWLALAAPLIWAVFTFISRRRNPPPPRVQKLVGEPLLTDGQAAPNPAPATAVVPVQETRP